MKKRGISSQSRNSPSVKKPPKGVRDVKKKVGGKGGKFLEDKKRRGARKGVGQYNE